MARTRSSKAKPVKVVEEEDPADDSDSDDAPEVVTKDAGKAGAIAKRKEEVNSFSFKSRQKSLLNGLFVVRRMSESW